MQISTSTLDDFYEIPESIKHPGGKRPDAEKK